MASMDDAVVGLGIDLAVDRVYRFCDRDRHKEMSPTTSAVALMSKLAEQYRLMDRLWSMGVPRNRGSRQNE